MARDREAYRGRDGRDPTHVIRENQRLLEQIGVVPQPAKRFVAAVEGLGGAAKISGAGAVRGTKGGVVLAHLTDADAMSGLMENYPEYRWEPLKMATEGAALMTSDAIAV